MIEADFTEVLTNLRGDINEATRLIRGDREANRWIAAGLLPVPPQPKLPRQIEILIKPHAERSPPIVNALPKSAMPPPEKKLNRRGPFMVSIYNLKTKNGVEFKVEHNIDMIAKGAAQRVARDFVGDLCFAVCKVTDRDGESSFLYHRANWIEPRNHAWNWSWT